VLADPPQGGSRQGQRWTTPLATLATALLAFGLVIAGFIVLQSRAALVTVDQAAPLVLVDTQSIELVSSYEVPRAFAGQVEAAQSTDIAFELSGKILNVAFEEASFVKKGDVLARLDVRLLENRKATQLAARRALEAQLELSHVTTERRRALTDKGFATGQQLDQARLQLLELRAHIAEIDSVIAGIDIQIAKSAVRAPFDGRVGNRFVDIGATVGVGQPVMTLLQDAPPQMRVGLSHAVASRLDIGTIVSADIGTNRYRAILSQLRADIDPQTRTRTAIFTLERDGVLSTPLYGQTGTVTLLETIRQDGAWLPVPALQESIKGLWTVWTVRPGEQTGLATIAPEAVEILYADEKRAFVRGTFMPGTHFVESGPHRVTAGQKVRVEDTTALSLNRQSR